MAYLDYPGLAYFKSLLDENYLRTNYEGDTVIDGNVTFTNPVDASVKNDWLGQQIDKTYIKNLRPEDDGEVALIYGDNHEEVITIDTAVTQVRSDANEMYPILLCYDANAEVNQISKSVRYGHNVTINPAYGYVYANSYVAKHPTYNRTISATTRVEWASDFRDSVLNPVGQVFEYIDPVSSGGEHRMEFRLYGNPNVAGINTPNINDETNTVSLGVSATRGDALTFFGYAPSTPIYLEDGSTMRKSLVRGDQYGKDIITRDWLNLNGSVTGLVHTYMDETIDGYKTFLKTVTIDSGDDNNKAGLNVQGDANIDSGDDNNPSNLHVQGDGDIDGNLNVDGNETVGGDSTVDGDLGVGGTINKITDNTTQEYVTYVTSQSEIREIITENLIKIGKGLAKDEEGRIYVDFDSATDDVKNKILSSLGIKIPLLTNISLHVDKDNVNATTTWRNSAGVLDKTVGTTSKPFKTIQAAVNCATQGYSVGSNHITIIIHKSSDAGYNELVTLPNFDYTTGYITLTSENISSTSTYAVLTNKATSGTEARIAGNILQCSGGSWNINCLKFDAVFSSPNDGVSHYPGCVGVSEGKLYLYACSINASYTGSAPSSGEMNLRILSVGSYGALHIVPYENKQTTITVSKGNSSYLWVFAAEQYGRIVLHATNEGNSSSSWHNIVCSGSCDIFVRLFKNASMTGQGGAAYNLKFTGNVTGQKCQVLWGSSITLADGLPGSEAGTCSTSTASYVDPSSILE